jgi:hypothetical protein
VTLRIPPTRDAQWWNDFATQALDAFIQSFGAAVWPEVEAYLAETSWAHDHVDATFPGNWRVDAHHLTAARSRLVRRGLLVEDPAVLGQTRVSAWIDGRALSRRGRRTEVRLLAASKRRKYRRFLSWTSRPDLCGAVAEQVVDQTLRSLQGLSVWLPREHRPGRINNLVGRPVPFGPLDAAGAWPTDRDDPNAGFIHFGIEVKNLRSTIYPWDHETWDLLAKVGAFPQVVPVLVARRIHPLTFKFFKDVGALGTEMRSQWFSNSIDETEFERITSSLGFRDARRIDPSSRLASLERFFSRFGPALATEQSRKWQLAAPIAARYDELRNPGLDPDDRHELWSTFAAEAAAAGLYELGGWAPLPRAEEEGEEPYDDVDW